MPGRFIAVIGALVWRRSDGKYLVLQRAATRDVGAGEWECVTGRLEQGEGFLAALRREALEELGTEVQVECILRTAHFYRGEAQPENEAVGVMYGCSVDDGDEIHLSDEHSAHAWISADEARDRFPEGDRLRDLIARADFVRKLAPDELRRLAHIDGFQF